MFTKDELRIIEAALRDHIEVAEEMATDSAASQKDRDTNMDYVIDVRFVHAKVLREVQ